MSLIDSQTISTTIINVCQYAHLKCDGVSNLIYGCAFHLAIPVHCSRCRLQRMRVTVMSMIIN